MATFVLIHGGGSRGGTFDLLRDELRALGHETIAPDLPIDEQDGDLTRCACHVIATAGERPDLVVVGHSFGGLVAPLVAAWTPTRLLVLMSAMVPVPGETGAAWWDASGWEDATEALDMSDERATFLHDVPDELVRQELASGREHCDASMQEPWPLQAWPEVPTRVLAFADDRFLPIKLQERLAVERIGIEAHSMGGSHAAYQSRPAEVARHLDAYWQDVSAGEQAIDGRGTGRP